MSVSTSGSSGATSPEISNALELAPGGAGAGSAATAPSMARYVESPTSYYPPSTAAYSPFEPPQHRSSSRDEYNDRHHYSASFPATAEYVHSQLHSGVSGTVSNFTRNTNYEQPTGPLQAQGRPGSGAGVVGSSNTSYNSVVGETSYSAPHGIAPYHATAQDRSSSVTSSPSHGFSGNANASPTSTNLTGYTLPHRPSSGDAQYGRTVLGAGTNEGSFHSMVEPSAPSGSDRRLSSVPGASSYPSASPFSGPPLFDHNQTSVRGHSISGPSNSYAMDPAFGGRMMAAEQQYISGGQSGSPHQQRSHSVVLPPIRLNDSQSSLMQHSPMRRHSETISAYPSHPMMMGPSVGVGSYGMGGSASWDRVNVSDTRSHHPHGSMGLSR